MWQSRQSCNLPPKGWSRRRSASSWLAASSSAIAGKSGTATPTEQAFQSRGSDPKLSARNKWYRALEGAGVEFIDEDAERGPGVRLRLSVKPAGKRK